METSPVTPTILWSGKFQDGILTLVLSPLQDSIGFLLTDKLGVDYSGEVYFEEEVTSENAASLVDLAIQKVTNLYLACVEKEKYGYIAAGNSMH